MSKICIVPHPVLRQPAERVTVLDKGVQKVIKDMEKTLKEVQEPEGVGLAAPQIGQSLRIFMIRPKSGGSITTFINPEIIRYSQRQTKPAGKHGVYEGCLSIPHHYAPVTRSTSVTVRYQTLNTSPRFAKLPSPIIGEGLGGEVLKTFSGFSAHIIQHEMDHLNGILFIDRVLEQNQPLYKIQGEEWEEVSI